MQMSNTGYILDFIVWSLIFGFSGLTTVFVCSFIGKFLNPLIWYFSAIYVLYMCSFRDIVKYCMHWELHVTGAAAFRIACDIWLSLKRFPFQSMVHRRIDNKDCSSVVCCCRFYDKHVSFFIRCKEKKRIINNW